LILSKNEPRVLIKLLLLSMHSKKPKSSNIEAEI